MYKFAILDPNKKRIVVTIPSNRQNEYVSYDIKGELDPVEQLKERIKVGFGAFGHPMDLEQTNAEDFHAFLTSEKDNGYKFSLVGDHGLGYYLSKTDGDMVH